MTTPDQPPGSPYQPAGPYSPSPPQAFYQQPARPSLWRRLPPQLRALVIVAAIGAPLVGGMWALATFLNAVDYGVPHQDPARPDVSVQLSDCRETGAGLYGATLTVTNPTSRTRTVYVDIDWLDSGGTRLATTTAVVSSVDPGQSARQDAVGAGSKSGSAPRCSYRVR